MKYKEDNAITIEDSEIKEWMLQAANSPGRLSVEPATHLPRAYEIMRERQLERLPVTQDGRLLGVVTKDKIERYLPDRVPTTPPSSWQLDQAMTQTTVGNIMNLKPATLAPETSMKTAAKIMLRDEVDALPVVEDEDKFLGMISLQDLLYMLARS